MSYTIEGVNANNITVADSDGDECHMVVDRGKDGTPELFVSSVASSGCNIKGDDLRALMELLMKACATPVPW